METGIRGTFSPLKLSVYKNFGCVSVGNSDTWNKWGHYKKYNARYSPSLARIVSMFFFDLSLKPQRCNAP